MSRLEFGGPSVRPKGPTLLLLAFYFPPYNIVGAVRPHQIAEHFVNNGWRVVIVCAEAAHIPLNSDLSTSSFTVRRIPEPALLAWAQSPLAQTASVKRPFAWLGRYALKLVRCMSFPDLEALACRSLRDEALDAIEAHRPDLILSTAPPFSVHLVAAQVASRSQVPWVADNRDIWSGSPYRRCRLPKVVERKYERSVLGSAITIIGVTRAMVRHYSDLMSSNSVSLAMNGFAQIASSTPVPSVPEQTTRLVVLYAGSMYGGRRELGPLFRAISGDRSISDHTIVKLVGVEATVVDDLRKQFPEIQVVGCPYLPRASVAEHCAAADVLVVAQTSHIFDKGVIPGKFFFYLQFSRPILVVGDSDSELGELVNSHDLGVCSRDPAVIADFLKELAAGERPRHIVPPQHLSAAHQMQLLLDAVSQTMTGES